MLLINFEKEKARRLMKHLEKEHPSTKGKMYIKEHKRKFRTKKKYIPDFESQAKKMTKLKW